MDIGGGKGAHPNNALDNTPSLDRTSDIHKLRVYWLETDSRI